MRPLRPAPVSAVVLSVATGAAAVALSRSSDWRPAGVFALLLAFALLADRFEIRTRSGAYVAGSMPVFVLGAVLFGPAPGAALGAAVALAQHRKPWRFKLRDPAPPSTFPFLAGLAPRAPQIHDPLGQWPPFHA